MTIEDYVKDAEQNYHIAKILRILMSFYLRLKNGFPVWLWKIPPQAYNSNLHFLRCEFT